MAERAPREAPATRRAQRSVPAFALYGESGRADAQLLHIEPIAARSARHRWEIAAHRHAGLCQTVWIEQGSVRVSLDDRQATVQAPAAVVLPPGVVHAFRFLPGTQGWVLSFSPRRVLEGEAAPAAAQLQALFEAPALLAWAEGSAASRPLAQLLATLAAEFDATAGQAPTVVWLARAVLWRLEHSRQQQRLASAAAAGPVDAAAAGRAPALHAPLYTRFVRLVEQHHAAHWPMTRYAQALGLSLARLNQLTRQEAGRAALALVHERLLREAQRLLQYTHQPVSQIGFALGFEDPAYFARFFRRLAGCSPAVWRSAQAAQDAG
jgi:AraC family transcriptional regulator, transcriptional activator of pobA